MYENAKLKLQDAFSKRNKEYLNESLNEFEATLITEQMKESEKGLLEIAYEEKEYLRDLECM